MTGAPTWRAPRAVDQMRVTVASVA